MGKSKGSRIIITLECKCRNLQNIEQTKRKNGISRYTTSKNKRNTPNRIEIKKFCSYCNCHRLFKEIK
uniref:Large ribosomal subunit protein bL33c n=1 Tax=Ophidocladus simpliciusculus TaxID=1261574 RepID=A0A1Z1MJ69_9FLOR|nr:ribosomal protein L33 [Ophidocladus simpliciusculus]ARW65996.1 ribosomal protein L33 [Ophidocladus simpliciusculus]